MYLPTRVWGLEMKKGLLRQSIEHLETIFPLLQHARWQPSFGGAGASSTSSTLSSVNNPSSYSNFATPRGSIAAST